MPEMPKVPGAFPLTHLWFLYQLLLIYVAVIAVRGIVARLDPAQKLRGLVDKAVTALDAHDDRACSRSGLPVAAALMSLPIWFYWQGIPTPDQSLIPQIPASVGFGTAFAFGWLVHRSSDALAGHRARAGSRNLVLAIARHRLAAAHHARHARWRSRASPRRCTRWCSASRCGAGCSDSPAPRCASCLTTAPARRYIADASYWIYLAHLPVVAAFQVWVGHWPLHWGVKYPVHPRRELRGAVR